LWWEHVVEAAQITAARKQKEERERERETDLGYPSMIYPHRTHFLLTHHF
jgi:hypothetical protein